MSPGDTLRSSDPTAASRGWGYPRVVAAAGGAFFAIAGLWAMVAPESFFDSLATFEPYNQHLIQDIGAFQVGLGAVLLLAALARADALATGLLGVGAGSAAHVVSHAMGHDLGGQPAIDIPFFSILTVVLVTAGVLQWSRSTPPNGPPGDPAGSGPKPGAGTVRNDADQSSPTGSGS